MIKNSRAKYYEETDFTGVMRNGHGKRVVPIVKRITMNISERVYNEANELDSYLGMGYQNGIADAEAKGVIRIPGVVF